eukprot:277300_1
MAVIMAINIVHHHIGINIMHCANSYFAADTENDYCCAAYPSAPISDTSSDTPPSACNEHSVLTVQNDEISNAVVTSEDLAPIDTIQPHTKIVCFEVTQNAICYHPEITVLFERIRRLRLDRSPFVVAYETEDNRLNDVQCAR